jgi:NTP-dependent ternary system trypsin peptidase co-occuring protein
MTRPSDDVKVNLTTDADGNELDRPVTLYVEARQGKGAQNEEVANRTIEGLRQAFDAIQIVGSDAARAVAAISPDKYTVELNFEFTVEAGGLVATLVRAGGTASVKVTLEWDKSKPAANQPGS